jgi:thiamine-monophosphate kinase
MTAHIPLGPGGEFDRIRGILERLGDRAAPSGDDCAIVDIGAERIAISTDIVIEGTHFRAGWLSPEEIGWRAAAAACSDLAAVAAEPRGVLTSVGAPAGWSSKTLSDLLDGVGAVAESIGAKVWGGDLVRSDRLVIDMTVVGTVGQAVRRSGGRVGDRIWVTGQLGAPLAALRAWEEGKEPEASARERFAHPIPRIVEAQWLRDRGAEAMIDLSDGLLGDAGHLAASSNVQCAIEIERVPVHAAAGASADALVSGEEYELLVAMPEEFDESQSREFAVLFDLSLVQIGEIREGEGVIVLEKGEPMQLDEGFRQFD